MGYDEPAQARIGMTTPAVSIVIPCHNGGRFLDTLMASLAAQTFRDFEVSVVDSAPDERCAAIVRERFPTVALIRSTERTSSVESVKGKPLPPLRPTNS